MASPKIVWDFPHENASTKSATAPTLLHALRSLLLNGISTGLAKDFPLNHFYLGPPFGPLQKSCGKSHTIFAIRIWSKSQQP
jgi:hypothetical protein